MKILLISNDYSKVEIAKTQEQLDFLKSKGYFEADTKALMNFDNTKKLANDNDFEFIEIARKSSIEIARKSSIDKDEIIGVWTDGLMLSSDALPFCKFKLKAGSHYKVSVKEIVQ